MIIASTISVPTSDSNVIPPLPAGFNIVFPSGYFYPCGYEDQQLPEYAWRRDESFAVHHWAGSWLKPEAFVKKE